MSQIEQGEAKGLEEQAEMLTLRQWVENYRQAEISFSKLREQGPALLREMIERLGPEPVSFEEGGLESRVKGTTFSFSLTGEILSFYSDRGEFLLSMEKSPRWLSQNQDQDDSFILSLRGSRLIEVNFNVLGDTIYLLPPSYSFNNELKEKIEYLRERFEELPFRERIGVIGELLAFLIMNKNG